MATKTTKTTKLAKPKARATKKTTDAVASVMPAPSEDKLKIISQFATKQGDTGSPEVQVALLTERIERLGLHLKENSSDNHSRRGLLGMISKRRRLLNYLSEKNEQRYKDLMKKLKIA